jgi:hypothetical protein
MGLIARTLAGLLTRSGWLLALLIRRLYGPIRHGRLPRAVRMVGCLVVLATVAGHSVQQREGQKLGAYFGHGVGRMPISAEASSLWCSPAIPPRS